MAGLDAHTPRPTNLVVHQASRELEVSFDSGETFRIPFELMRVHSPSAEVQGHGPGQETVQTGKREVQIVALEPVGHYAVKPTFSDGHDSGLFSWALLHEMGSDVAGFWRRYEEQLARSSRGRDDEMPVKAASSCSKP